MRITVKKNGTKLVLAKAELRCLHEAGAVAAAVAAHTNDPELEEAGHVAAQAIGTFFWLLGQLNAAAALGSDAKAQDGKQDGDKTGAA